MDVESLGSGARRWAGYRSRVLLPTGRATRNNYPGNNARYPGTPDDTEMVVLNLRTGRAVDPEPELIAHRGAGGHRPEHTWRRTSWRSGCVLATSSLTWCRPRTACW